MPRAEWQAESMRRLAEFYCRELAEDGQDGSSFDCAVLDALRGLEQFHPGAPMTPPAAPPETTDPRPLNADEGEHVERMRRLATEAIERGWSQKWAAAGEVLLLIGYIDRLRALSSPAREPAPTPDLVAIEALLDAYAAEEYRAGNPEPIKTAAADMPRRRARAALLSAISALRGESLGLRDTLQAIAGCVCQVTTKNAPTCGQCVTCIARRALASGGDHGSNDGRK